MLKCGHSSVLISCRKFIIFVVEPAGKVSSQVCLLNNTCTNFSMFDEF